MIISRQQLIGLSVKTESGVVLGQIKDFEVNTDNSQIVNYIVSSSHLVEKILTEDLVIGFDQIISLNDKEMIVFNGIIPQKTSIKELASI